MLNVPLYDFVKGVLVHQGNSVDSHSSEILDMSPTDSSHYSLVALLTGKSFVDPDAPGGGVKITLDSLSATSATVTVKLGQG